MPHIMQKRPKPINSLMKYLRDKKGIDISGSSDKLKLRNMGYYHGYKGYRYIFSPSNKIQFKNFDELNYIYSFDTKLKTLFYPWVMFIETALKNYVLESVVESAKSDNFNTIYNSVLDNFKKYINSSNVKRGKIAKKEALKKRIELRSRIYKLLADKFNLGNKIANHFLSNDRSVPIWAIFELLTLGEFGYFVSCINFEVRSDISKNIGIKQSDDSDASLTQKFIFILKEFRNAIAHNDIVFDTRFRTSEIKDNVFSALSNETSVKALSFKTITDYLVFVVYLLKKFGVSKKELNKLVNDFDSAVTLLKHSIDASTFNKIIYTDNRNKIKSLKEFILK